MQNEALFCKRTHTTTVTCLIECFVLENFAGRKIRMPVGRAAYTLSILPSNFRNIGLLGCVLLRVSAVMEIWL